MSPVVRCETARCENTLSGILTANLACISASRVSHSRAPRNARDLLCPSLRRHTRLLTLPFPHHSSTLFWWSALRVTPGVFPDRQVRFYILCTQQQPCRLTTVLKTTLRVCSVSAGRPQEAPGSWPRLPRCWRWPSRLPSWTGPTLHSLESGRGHGEGCASQGGRPSTPPHIQSKSNGTECDKPVPVAVASFIPLFGQIAT